MSPDDALATLDWATFHGCNHPVQRIVGKVLPCAECSGLSHYIMEAPPDLPARQVVDPASLAPGEFIMQVVSFVRRELLFEETGTKRTLRWGHLWTIP